jgi:hypothetical protein
VFDPVNNHLLKNKLPELISACENAVDPDERFTGGDCVS